MKTAPVRSQLPSEPKHAQLTPTTRTAEIPTLTSLD